MQAIHEGIAAIGTEWAGPTAEETLKLYTDAHSTTFPSYIAPLRSNARYGPADRNVLDIYAPASEATALRPVLLCHYFASRGFVLVAMNYRLVPEARYPSGGEDVELALKWIRDNIGTDENGRGDPDQLVLIGQSAGAAHIASYLYRDGDADLMQAGKATPHRHPVAKAVAYLSAPFFFDASKARRAQTLREYFGTDDPEQVWPHSSAGLLQSAPSTNHHVSPQAMPTLVTVGQYDSKEIIDATFQFVDVYRTRNKGVMPLFAVHPNHNHISNVLSLGTEDEEVGEMLLLFIRRALAVK